MDGFFRYALFVLAILTPLAWREWRLQPDGTAYMHALYVGQGDGLLIASPSGQDILIDGGPDWSVLEGLGEKLPFFDRSIALLVLTHPDADHVNGLPEVLRRYNVRQVLLTGVEKQTPVYRELLSLLAENDIPVILAHAGTDIDFGDGLVLDTVWPLAPLLGEHPKKANNTSVVLRALCGKDAILLTGDIEREAELAILQSGADVHANILKAAHHGSRTSSATGFLLATKAELVVISSGRDNSFGHPHAEVTKRYASLGMKTRNTAEEGVVTVPFCRTMAL